MFRVEFRHNHVRAIIKYKATVASATNLVYKVHSSACHTLDKFQIRSGDEWIDYDMPEVVTHASIKARINELIEFHEAFYDSHQG